MSKAKIQQALAKMIEAYENGDAEDDLRGFLAGWAETIAPKEKKATKQYVLVHGHPFDHGLSVEGPYDETDAQDLEEADLTRYGGWWVVCLDEPSKEPSP